MRKRAKKCIFAGAAFSVLALAALYLVPIPIPVSRTLAAMECRLNDASYAVPRTISLQGTYFFYLYREDAYLGRIAIEGYDNTRYSATVHTAAGLKNMPLLYAGEYPMVGQLSCEGLFDRVLILIKSQETKKDYLDTGLYIAAPAKTREEAAAVAQRLALGSTWLKELFSKK